MVGKSLESELEACGGALIPRVGCQMRLESPHEDRERSEEKKEPRPWGEGKSWSWSCCSVFLIP